MLECPNFPFRVSTAPDTHITSSPLPASLLFAIASIVIGQRRRVSSHHIYNNLIRAFSTLIGSSRDRYLSPSSIALISELSLLPTRGLLNRFPDVR
jgi:hypothetical protein